MPVRAVFFDVGETLVNEERYWRELAALVGLEPHVIWAALGATIALGEGHQRIYAHLGIDPPRAGDLVVYRREDLYPDALPCLELLRREGYFLGVAGNQTGPLETWARDEGLPVEIVASSASWGVEKPARAFFERIVEEANCEPREVAYVGDRVDNDVVPAVEAGLVAVHIRRGPWGYLQGGADRAHLRLASLAELPAGLARLADREARGRPDK